MAADTDEPTRHAPAPPSGEPRIDPDRPPNPIVRRAQRTANPIRRLLAVLGPGLVTGASDDDPSGIGTYAQAGARFGYATLWTTIALLPLMSAVQFICAKIGLVNGRGLAGALREHYPRWLLLPTVLALFVANTINAGADIGAIAAAVNLLLPVPIPVLIVPVGAAIVGVQVLGSYRLIERTFKWLTLALLGYVAAAVLSRPDLGEVLRGSLVPTVRLDSAFVAMLVAIAGTTLSPYLFFWQASHEVEEEVGMGRRRLWQRQGASRRELRFALADTIAGMAASEIVAYSIILATAAALSGAGHAQVRSAADAAEALRPVAGAGATVLLAVALIGSGVLAVPVLTGAAAYALAETFHWRSGLDRPPGQAREFYAVIGVATLVGIGINYVGVESIDALVLAAVVNGLLAPPLLVLVLVVANNRNVMGRRRNGPLLNALGGLTAVLMTLAALALVGTTMLGHR